MLDTDTRSKRHQYQRETNVSDEKDIAIVVVENSTPNKAKLPGLQMHPARTLRPSHGRPPLSTERNS